MFVNFKIISMSTTLSGATKVATKESKLQEFFVEQLQDIYWAEQKLVKTLPKMAEAANSPELKQAFQHHLQETENHVTRLERVFESIGEKAKTKKCLAMAGIVDEGEDIIDDTEENTSQRDVGLIFAGQKAEHYEIATYGGLVQLARTLGYEEAVREMSATLQEEKNADTKLTSIGESTANPKASREPRK